jgi:hypothetical protein
MSNSLAKGGRVAALEAEQDNKYRKLQKIIVSTPSEEAPALQMDTMKACHGFNIEQDGNLHGYASNLT